METTRYTDFNSITGANVIDPPVIEIIDSPCVIEVNLIPKLIADIPVSSPSIDTSNSAFPIAKEKKPSEMALDVILDNRETGRITDAIEQYNQLPASLKKTPVVCCCINPYIDEEPSAYFPGFNVREGDVYKHRAVVRKEVICFNLCFITESETKISYQRASDGKILTEFKKENLTDVRKYYLLKTDRCKHRHHDLKRFTMTGRILTYLCTFDGLVSTLKKVCCITNCVDEIGMETVRCERSLYRKH